MPEVETHEERPDSTFTEQATGAESTYGHGGQRPLENPPAAAGEDVSKPVADDLNAMHVESKLESQDPAPDLERQRDEGFRKVDERVQARERHMQAVNEAHEAVRDRTLAVQEEIATRERDGAMPGTPAFERRRERILDIVGQTGDVDDNRPIADRIEAIAVSLHTNSPAATEEAQHQLMAIAAELRDEDTREPFADKEAV